MNISKVNYEYSFRIFRNGMNIQMNIQYIKKWRLNILKNIQYLNEYSIKYLFKYSTPFKMLWIFI